jgi:two-component system nitrate/nitrite response regulator NarL
MSLLLCDDQEMFLDSLAMSVLVAGRDVLAKVSSPEALLGAVDRFRPALCLVDAIFGGVPRLDVALGVRAQFPATRVVLLTSANTEEMWAALAERRIQGIVAKSCDLRELDRLVGRALEGRRAVGGVLPPRRCEGHAVQLTRRERDVLELLDRGRSTDEMAAELGLARDTVRTHVQSLLDKMQVTDRVHAVLEARRLGLLRTRELSGR